jgi:hypothetical protein
MYKQEIPLEMQKQEMKTDDRNFLKRFFMQKLGNNESCKNEG